MKLTKQEKDKYVRNPGKTEKDKASGAKQRNIQNKAARAAWQNDSGSGKTTATFPSYTCNGHRYQRRTGKK